MNHALDPGGLDQIFRSARTHNAFLDRPIADAELRERLLNDELLSSLLVLHGLHPRDVADRVSDALEKVRPYLGSHGGDVELISVDEASGVVKLRLGGSCDGCPSSMVSRIFLDSSAFNRFNKSATALNPE